jgi:hypothetical protein
MSPGRAQSAAKPSLLAAVLAIVMMAAYRLAPHPWNVAPAGAMFLLSGFYVGPGWRRWALPFAAVMASDALIYLQWNASLWHPERLVDYAAFALITLMGVAVSGRGLVARLASVAVTPALFYLVSNFGVWLFSANLYPHTPQGLAECYLAGLPFMRGTVLGDWLFAGAGILAIEGLPAIQGLQARRA